MAALSKPVDSSGLLPVRAKKVLTPRILKFNSTIAHNLKSSSKSLLPVTAAKHFSFQNSQMLHHLSFKIALSQVSRSSTLGSPNVKLAKSRDKVTSHPVGLDGRQGVCRGDTRPEQAGRGAGMPQL